MKIFLLIAIPYLAVSAMFLMFIIRTQRHILDSKMGRRHPERFRDPLWLHVVISVLWPLQIIGFVMYIFRENM
jgi:hypothetical protein